MAASNSIQIRYLESHEYDLWDQFVDQCDFGTIFHKSQWLNPISKWQNLNFSIVGCYKGNQLTGGMAFTWKKKFGRIPIIQLPVKTPVFGPVISYSDTKYLSKIESQIHTVTKDLINFLLKDYQLFYAQFPPAFIDIRPYNWEGFDSDVHYTYSIKFHSEIDLEAGFNPDIKRRIKKAYTLKYQLHENATEEYIAYAWDLEQKSFDRQGFKMQYTAKESFVSFILDLVQKKSGEVFTIMHEEKPVASVIMILDQATGTAYYWHAGADKDFLNTGLNQLLVLKIMEKYKVSDLKSFDFVGADTESIARYKSTFNFPLVPMYSVSKSRSIARLGMAIKNLIQ